jgi:hypothetical protein
MMGRLASTPVRAALLIAAALIAVAAVFLAPAATLARGWLVAFALASGFPLGSLALLMIHRLTGGAWGEAAGPVLRTGALLVPVAALGFIPVALALPALYPWAADPASISASVRDWYLNPTAFLARAAIVLGLWSMLGVVFGLGRGGRLLAGLGLALSAVATVAVAVDWFLSVDPRYVSSAFALLVASRFLVTVLAVVAVIGPPVVGRASAGDIATLMVAGLMACVYLELMSFIVAWYGNLPPKAAWYLARSGAGWSAMAVAALAFTLLALVTLLGRRAGSDTWQGLRVAGLATLAALALETAWLIAPAFADAEAALAAALGGLAVLILVALALWPRGWTAAAMAPSAGSLPSPRQPTAVAAVQHVYDEMWRRPQRAPQVTHHATMPIEDMHEREQLEDPAVENRPVLGSIFGFIALVVVCVVVAYGYVWVELRQRLVLAPVTSPEPRLQLDPSADLQRFEASQGAALEGYAWVDKPGGVARIPIERAMDIIAQRGNAAFDNPLAPAPQRSGALP